MSNRLYIPKINPVKFVEIHPVEVPQYLSKHFENYRFQDLQYPWDQQTKYEQKWQMSDTIYLQFESNFDPITLSLVDCYDIERISLPATQKLANKFLPGWYAYEVAMSLAAITTEGNYWLKMILPDGTILISEPKLIKQKHPYTILHEYKHKRDHGDVVFQTGIQFGFRVEGTFGKLKPGTKDVLYEDEVLDPVVLSSKPFNAFTLRIGGSKGVPDWVVDIYNRLWTCSSVLLDGKPFAKSGESKIEFREAEKYPMRGIIMDVREGINRGSKIVDATVDPNKRLIVVHNIEGKLFGDLGNAGNTGIVPIIDIE